MSRDSHCVLCGYPCNIDKDPRTDFLHVMCERCGRFSVSRIAVDDDVRRMQPTQLGRLSACTRERHIRHLEPMVLVSQPPTSKSPTGAITVVEVLELVFPRRVQDRMDRALLNLCAVADKPGHSTKLSQETDYPVLMCEDSDAAGFLLREMAELKLIDLNATDRMWLIKVRAAGFARAEELEQVSGRRDSDQVFVAMWFADDLHEAYEHGIKRAVTGCGFRPLRIDAKETNAKICDEIIAEVKRSRFLIADFTGHRGGVYFEAGYAMGLGIPVIWTCREDCIDDLHFDTRQYSHVVWADPTDLYERLARRIAATIPGAKLP